jgi:DNA repair exonuclease SbcCD ATPase subunit
LDRLERIVTKLVERQRRLERENATLRSDLDEKERRVRELDVGILEANQLRQDVAKRIDELITQIDHLGAQLDAQAESLNE